MFSLDFNVNNEKCFLVVSCAKHLKNNLVSIKLTDKNKNLFAIKLMQLVKGFNLMSRSFFKIHGSEMPKLLMPHFAPHTEQDKTIWFWALDFDLLLALASFQEKIF